MPKKKKSSKRSLVDKTLESIYFNTKSPAGFSGKTRLKRALKNKVSSQNVDKWLSKTDTYTLHKPARKRFKRRKYIVSGINALWQCDLTELTNLAKYNSGYKYILLQIDVFSKRANARKLKTKSGKEVAEAFQDILKHEKIPDQLQTDQGKEFFNAHFQSILKQHHINHYYSKNQEIKASMVERLQRTLKNKLFRYFTHSNSYRWIDVLPELIDSYNQSFHSSIGMRLMKTIKK